MLLTQEEIMKVVYEVLPNLSHEKVVQIAQAIVERQGKWEEISASEIGAGISIQCRDICTIGEALFKGHRVRAFMVTENS